MITAERLRELLLFDPVTGVFTWKVTRPPVVAGAIAGSVSKKRGYCNITVDLRPYRAHRLAWFYVYGRWPRQEIDHINGNRADNRIANLREVSRGENMQNLREPINNSCGFLGVSINRGRYMARIKTNGKLKNLGYFDTPEEAHKAYIVAKRQLHPAGML